jgi:NhaA family Na+:H+ antiporter
MSSPKKNLPRPLQLLFDYSGFLLLGTAAALLWANLDPGSESTPGTYSRFIHFEPFAALTGNRHDAHENGHDGEHANGEHSATTEHARGDAAQPADSTEQSDSAEQVADDSPRADEGEQGVAAHESTETEPAAHASHGRWTLHFLVTDLLMALFFAIAAKEVWEAMLPGGALSNLRKAATPLLATLGGVVGPAAIYVAGAYLFDTSGHLSRGWAIPCATDIAFSYLAARLIFGAGHPAIAFLLLLAIADDAAGLVIIAVFYPDPSVPLNLWWLLLTVAAMATCIGMRKMRIHSFWWYLLIPGVLSWISFYKAGIHSALGLVPIIPLLPHAKSDLGIYAKEELGRHDTLNEFEHFWKRPVEVILGLFALVNAGVVFSNVGLGTWLVLGGLIVGKPLGITLLTLFAEKGLRLELPPGMTYRHVVSLGMVAGIGFTVALFVSTAAFPASSGVPLATIDSVKMGALASFSAALVAYVGARLLGVRALKPSGQRVVSESTNIDLYGADDRAARPC